MSGTLKKRAIYLLAAAGAAAIAFLFFAFKGEGVRLDFTVNSGAVYSLKLRVAMLADKPGISDIRENLEMHGFLNFIIVYTSRDVVRTRFQFSDIDMRLGGVNSNELKRIYMSPFTADIDRSGRFVSFGFMKGMSARDRDLLSGIMRTLQFVNGSPIFGRWETQEADTNGNYIASYRIEGSRVSKEKIEYITENENRIEVKKSRMSFDFKDRSPWVAGAEGEELLVFYQGDEPYFKVSTSVSLNVTDIKPPASLSSSALDNDLIITADLDRHEKNRDSSDDYIRESRFRELFGDKPLKMVIDGLLRENPGFSAAAIAMIMKYLELRPESASEIHEYIKTVKLIPVHQAMLVHALGRNGSENSQRALSNIMHDREISGPGRVQAAVSFGFVSEHSEDSIDSLWEAFDSARALEAAEGDVSVGTSAVLSLGTAASASSAAQSDKSKIADRIKGRIRSELHSSADVNIKTALIHSAGNTGDSKMLDDVARYVKDPDFRVRSAAASAVGAIKTPRANGMLADALETENNVNVRNTIVSSLIENVPDDRVVQAVISSAENEDNDIVRGTMYRYLLRNREYPGVREAIERLLKEESSGEHRKILSRALYTKKKGRLPEE